MFSERILVSSSQMVPVRLVHATNACPLMCLTLLRTLHHSCAIAWISVPPLVRRDSLPSAVYYAAVHPITGSIQVAKKSNQTDYQALFATDPECHDIFHVLHGALRYYGCSTIWTHGLSLCVKRHGSKKCHYRGFGHSRHYVLAKRRRYEWAELTVDNGVFVKCKS
ncbi:hypothetical protein ANCCAN_20858 [Ancylostoma caninum]|uniref:Uncharacterized protein n=1 Tax=Ancylostoma caninum TaxID=29170 RepID=A0A368FM56_ANCCA|nr:hypothetical protein ANCCAN_20858 [Ancylostoma caninum]